MAQSVVENIFCASEREILATKKLERFLFKLEGYEPGRINDAQLGDDLRLCTAKWSSILSGKKTEFESKEECINFTERIMREVLKRGKITFHPEYRIAAGKAEVIAK